MLRHVPSREAEEGIYFRSYPMIMFSERLVGVLGVALGCLGNILEAIWSSQGLLWTLARGWFTIFPLDGLLLPTEMNRVKDRNPIWLIFIPHPSLTQHQNYL